ncbi:MULTISPECIES: hypothetical protein [Caryophanaceae]|uniref:hypothetical protein n=1 Tax=Caryophanaceae TaxID=186818 RepID=UPI002491E913|nr:hypothetical protein [Planomicrobium okeanokoites]
MISIYTIISEARIPDQLKLYFNDSNAIKEFLDEEKIRILEEVTTYFYSIYTFDTPQYCAAVVSAFKRSKDVDSFYSLLKGVIELDLQLTSKKRIASSSDEYLFISRNSINTVFKDATVLLIESIEKLSINNTVNLPLIYAYLGKIDLILSYTNESHFIKLKETAEYIISECNQASNTI